LDQACRDICEAFGGYGCYLVGSALDRPDWRDIDVRFIMSDEDFAVLFPCAGQHWEHDARWLLLTISISERLSKVSGLPIDFQFQPQTHANERHQGRRHALGIRLRAMPPRAKDLVKALTSLAYAVERRSVSDAHREEAPAIIKAMEDAKRVLRGSPL
jgi:hypothetical protein